MSRLIEAGGGIFNLVTRLFYVPAAIVSWLFLIAQSWKTVFSLLAVGLIFFAVSNYGGTVVSTVLTTMQTKISPIWVNQIRPIFAGIIQTFINPLFCWYNGFVIFPYSVGRNVLFPILREGGLLTTAQNLALFFAQFAKDLFLGYFVSGKWLSQEFDYGPTFARWATFITSWQGLWCFGCNDLCPIYTMTPNPIVSNQLKDPNYGDFLGKSFNGAMIVVQQMIYLVRQVIFPDVPKLPYLNFDRTFQLWCEAGTGLRISFENIMQEFWDAFIEFHFVWKDFLCFFDTLNCFLLRNVNFVLNLIIHADSTLSHFRNIDSTYWNNVTKFQATVIMNMLGPADYFAPIVLNQTVITSYQLLTRDQGAPQNGLPNPLFNTTTVGECFCIALTRLLCDPQANGTTCAQQYNGTLVAGIDPCCLTDNAGSLMANIMALTFEFTLHFMTVSDFLQFIDLQPFTTQIAYGATNTVNCIWMVFRVVQTFGFCIERIFSEITKFILLTGELVMRVVVALLVTPYWNEFLPGQCNFITCYGGNSPIDMATEYLNRISDPTLPDGLMNCLCFTLNTGFNVPFAGCGNFTCTPTGFIPPTNMSRKFVKSDFKPQKNINYREFYSRPWYGFLFPRVKYFNHTTLNFTKTSGMFLSTFNAMDKRIENFARSAGTCKRTLIPLNITTPEVNCTGNVTGPIPCFGLCCFPIKLVDLTTHTILFGARAINGAFQTRFGQGSEYWDGQACNNDMPCFKSDLTMFVIKLIAPVDCLCQFLKLLIPPQGFGDPCCGFTVLGELISCALQILINVGNSIAGDPEFLYIKGNSTDEPQIIKDFDVVLELSLDLFDCICNFVRTIFAVAFSGTSLEKAFDPCCIARVWVRAILESLRLLFRVVISLSTLDQVESQCYLYVNGFGNSRPSCPYAIEDLPIVKQFKNITSILFAPPVNPQVKYECSAVTNLDMSTPDMEGIPTCLCRMISAILVMVNKIDANYTGDLNAQPKCSINLCCSIYAGGDIFKTVFDFGAQLVATFWQNWEFKKILVIPNSIFPESFFIPQETLNFFFCDEYGTAGCNDQFCLSQNPSFYPGYSPLTNNQPIGTSYSGTGGIINSITQYNISEQAIRKLKCGKIEPALQSLKELLGGCMCASGDFTNLISGRTTCGINNVNANGPANVFDGLLRWFVAFVTQQSSLFPIRITWPSCFCCGGPNPDDPGMIRPFADLVVILLRQVIGLIRNIANPSYWAGQGGTLTDNNFNVASLTNNFDDLRKTWINRFLAPIADAICRFLTNSGCLISMILGSTCEGPKYEFISSWIRYIGETIIRALNVIEAAIKMFAQEPPGQCVGNPSAVNGNQNRPSDQGSIGQTGMLVPTCSPGSGTNPIFRGVTSNKLGSIVVASATYIVDALIGVSRFACSTVCPGLISQDPQINALASQTCSCWNDSPYTGISGLSGQVCGFQLCNCVYNSGRSSTIPFNYEFRCPNNTDTCTKEEIIRESLLNRGIGFNSTLNDPNVITGCDGRFSQPVQFGCVNPVDKDVFCAAYGSQDINFQGSTLSVTLQINRIPGICGGGCARSIGDQFIGGYESITIENPLLTWGTVYPAYKFKPKLVGSSVICEIPVLPSKKVEKRDVVPTTCVTCQNAPPQTQTQSVLVIPSATVDYFEPPMPSGGVNIISFYRNLEKLGRNLLLSAPGVVPPVYAPPSQQPACDRNFCILRGLCKNDQMVPCSPGTRILDGVYISLFKLLRCFMRSLFSGGGGFSNVVGGVADFLFTFILKIMSFVWQIAGGIIRFGVALGMFTFDFGVTLFIAPERALGNFIPSIVNLFQTFGAIFTQPVADGYKRIPFVMDYNFTKYDNFQDVFKIQRDTFFKSINLRSQYLKRFYMKEYGMKEDSPVMLPLLHLDMYHYKYSVGYYNYLYNNMNFTYESIVGTPEQLKHELFDSLHELRNQTVTFLNPAFDYIEDKLKDVHIYVPQMVRIIWNGSLRRHLPNLPNIKFNLPKFESIRIWPTNYKYNATKQRNVNAGKRLFHGAVHTIFPHWTTKEHHERFIINGDCRIVDGVIKEGGRIADYCLNEYQYNIPTMRDAFGGYLNKTSHLRGGFHQKFKGRYKYVDGGLGWKRPKVDFIPLEKRVLLHRDTYHRANHHKRNVFANIFQSITGIDILQTVQNWIDDFVYWMNNPNLDDIYFPDVGARYWFQFAVICKFPENVDCVLGIGLGNAIVEVGKYYWPIFAVFAILFPGFTSLLSIFFNIFIYIILVLAVGWHYSPACIALFPTSTIGDTGYTLPILPIPLNIFPALPMCMWDQLIALLDEIFSTCYTWIPQSITNEFTCGGTISIPNCPDVGISNPLEVLIYWGYRLFGNAWCDFMIGVTSWLSFLLDDTVRTCAAIQTASPSQMDRQLYCGIISIGTLSLVLLGGFIIGTFIIAVVLALINVLHALLLLLPFLPFYDRLIGTFQKEDEPQEVDGIQFVKKKQPGLVDYMAKGIKLAFLTKSREIE